MEGHWEWSEGGDEADTADLGGDGDLHGGFAEDYGADFGGEHLHTDLGGDEHDLGGAGAGHHGGDELEEPLGTEHATADYDQALHDTGDDPGHDPGHEPGHDPGHDPGADPGHESGHESGHDPGRESGHDQGNDPGHDPGHDPAHDTGPEFGPHEAHEAQFGTDPDVHADADDPAWHDVTFPDQLHLQDPPEPADGFPWTDADVLGGPDHDQTAGYDPAVTEHGGAEPAGLADYAGVEVPPGTDPWSLLLGSDDPATSSLATFWAPQ